MKWLKVYTKILHIVVATIVLSSCSEEDDCSTNSRHYINAYFYTVENIDDGITEKPCKIINLNITAFATDSVILNKATDIAHAELPLRYNEEMTTLVFDYGTNVNDTITFHHENKPYFLSMDCNYAVRQTLTDIRHTSHLIDSIAVTNPEANIDGKENIKIYY